MLRMPQAKVSGWHRLKRSARVTYPNNMLFFDTESWRIDVADGKRQLHTLRLGVMCYESLVRGKWVEKWHTFRSPQEFWALIDSYSTRKICIYAFAHNLNFDLFMVDAFGEGLRRGWQVKSLILDQSKMVVKLKRNQTSLCFIDTFNYSKASVEQLGDLLGIPKLSVDFDHTSEEALEVYCRRDVEIIRAFIHTLIEFLKSNDLGGFKATIGGIALNAFKHKLMLSDIWIHRDEKALELEAKSYKGGRVECFRLGSYVGKFYYLDVNSMFPFVMKQYVYPYKLIKVVEPASLDGLLRALNSRYLVIADVKVKVDQPCVGVKAGKLLFPIGEFYTTLTTPELKLVLQHGEILEVKRYVLYEAADLFSAYVTHLYELRKKFKSEGNEVFSEICKLLLNSLYGKFGQKKHRLKVIADNIDLPSGKYRFIDMNQGKEFWSLVLNGVMYRVEECGYADHAFPAISSFCGAYARCLLWSYMLKAGLDHVYYCDTDSLIVDEIGYRNLMDHINPDALGCLKIQTEGEYLELRGAKDYRLGDVVKRKGIRKTAKMKSVDTFTQEKWLKAKSLLGQGLTSVVVIEMQDKRLRYEYDKGTVLADGRVKPYVFGPLCPLSSPLQPTLDSV